MHHAPGELRADSASGAGGADGSPAGLQGAWDGSEVAGRLEALRSLLSQPDRLWEQFLTEAGRVLPLRQYGVAGAPSENHSCNHLSSCCIIHQSVNQCLGNQ